MYPFSKLTLKKDTGKRLFLNKDQILAMLNFEAVEGSLSCIYRDMFVFSIYAGGLRFSDALEIQHKHFIEAEQRIKKTINKTGRLHQFKIGQVALDIIKKYQKPTSKPDDFIFPIVKNPALFLKDKEYRYEITEKANKSANFQIQRIAKALEFPIHISFHLSRHSFATNALNNGMRIEHVSKLMDHQDIRTTQIYAKIINEELDKAVDEFIF
jgi:integrase/recombinase XerD